MQSESEMNHLKPLSKLSPNRELSIRSHSAVVGGSEGLSLSTCSPIGGTSVLLIGCLISVLQQRHQLVCNEVQLWHVKLCKALGRWRFSSTERGWVWLTEPVADSQRQQKEKV